MNTLLLTLKIKLRIYRNKLLAKKQFKAWQKNGKPMPPPHLVKQNLIKKYIEKYNPKIFIETGTYLGDMVYAQKNNFDILYSIEIQPFLFNSAQKRFKKDKHITILLGDSGKVLYELMPKISETALIWLDGHYSGGITGKSELNSPIFNELKAIFNNNNNNNVILIDDALCFDGNNDYPTYEKLNNFLNESSYQTQIIDNVIVAEQSKKE